MQDGVQIDAGTRSVGLVVNPERSATSGELAAALRRGGAEIVETTVDDADGLGRAVGELLGCGVDVVAAVGGDGTQRAVAAALVDAGSAVPLGIVPGGTVNLLGRVLGIHDVDDAAAAIVGGSRRSIDVGRVGGDVFVLNASTGWDAAVIDRVDDSYKRFGRLGYAVAGVRQWFDEEPGQVAVALDGESWFEGSALTVLVLNAGQRGSESLQLAPAAELDDGALDVVVFRRHSLAAFARSAWSVVRGATPDTGDVMRAQASRIEVVWAVPVAAQRDGDETDRGARFRYECDPGALRVCVPVSRSDG